MFPSSDAHEMYYLQIEWLLNTHVSMIPSIFKAALIQLNWC